MTANGWPFEPTENEEVVWEVVVCVLLVPLEKVVVDIVCVLVEAEAVELLEVAVVVVAVVDMVEKVVVDIVCVLVEAEAVKLLEVAVVVVAVDTRE